MESTPSPYCLGARGRDGGRVMGAQTMKAPQPEESRPQNETAERTQKDYRQGQLRSSAQPEPTRISQTRAQQQEQCCKPPRAGGCLLQSVVAARADRYSRGVPGAGGRNPRTDATL